MVYTECAPRWQQFDVAPAMQQPNSIVSTPLWWILKNPQGLVIQNRIQQERNETAGEWRTGLYKSDQQQSSKYINHGVRTTTSGHAFEMCNNWKKEKSPMQW